MLGVALVAGVQLLARLLLRFAWFRAAVERAREVLGLPPLGWRPGDEDGFQGLPGGPYGWDDEVYPDSDSGSVASSGSGESGAPFGPEEAAPDAPRRRGPFRSRKADLARRREQDIAARMIESDEGETVEWVNMCIRKSWRVFQRGLERWFTDLLQPVFDGLLEVSAELAAAEPALIGHPLSRCFGWDEAREEPAWRGCHAAASCQACEGPARGRSSRRSARSPRHAAPPSDPHTPGAPAARLQAGNMPRLVQRLRIVEFTLDHEAPYVSNMRRRNSRCVLASTVPGPALGRPPASGG